MAKLDRSDTGSRPRVSLLIPAFNVADILHRAVNAALDQTIQPIEVIIVDDGSTDGTHAVAQAFARNDPRVRVLQLKANGGAGVARAKGLSAARAPWIAILDADDAMEPERLGRLVSIAEDHQLDLIADNLMLVDPAAGPIRPQTGRVLWSKAVRLDDTQVRWVARFGAPLGHSGAVFRRLTPSGIPWHYDEGFEAAEDYELWQRMLEVGRGAVLPEILFSYRIHESTITATKGALMARTQLSIASRQIRSVLPDRISDPLISFLRAHLTREKPGPETIAAIVEAFDEMLENDITTCPRHANWFRRRAAGVLAQGILERGGAARDWRLLLAFFVAAWHHLPWLTARAFEDRGVSFLALRRRAFGR